MKNHLILGDWNALCDSCGRKFKASSLKKRWDGLIVCREDWEQRHPQDLLRVQREQISVPWSRPYPAEDTFIPQYLTDNENEYLGLVETTAVDFQKYIFNISIDASALNGAALNAYAINGTDNSTPIETEHAVITEVFNITLGRYVTESMSLAETIVKRLNKGVAETVSIAESTRFTTNKPVSESISLAETKALLTNKSATDSLSISESQAYTLVSPTSLNGSALNIYTLG